MKGDDMRAEQLATMLDGGPVADEIEPLLPAVDRIRDLLHRLGPDPADVAALLPWLYDRQLAAAQRPLLELAYPALPVRDMDAALAFYRDVLGLTPREHGERLAILDAGGGHIALRWTGRTARKSQLGDIHLEFRTADLDRTVEALRQRTIPVDVKSDRHRGRYAEVRDPDGHLVVLCGGAAVVRRATANRED